MEITINWDLITGSTAHIGVRGEDRLTYTIGDFAEASYDWDYDKDCSAFYTNGRQLPGTCAVGLAGFGLDLNFGVDQEEVIAAIEAAVSNFGYAGTLYILASNSAEFGADEDEIIMENAVVIGTIRL